MKKILLNIILYVCVAIIEFAIGIGCGCAIADSQSKSAIYDDDVIDLVALAIETDYNCEIKSYRFFKKEDLLVFHTGIGDLYYKPKRVVPFRYEWVEADL